MERERERYVGSRNSNLISNTKRSPVFNLSLIGRLECVRGEGARILLSSSSLVEISFGMASDPSHIKDQPTSHPRGIDGVVEGHVLFQRNLNSSDHQLSFFFSFVAWYRSLGIDSGLFVSQTQTSTERYLYRSNVQADGSELFPGCQVGRSVIPALARRNSINHVSSK